MSERDEPVVQFSLKRLLIATAMIAVGLGGVLVAWGDGGRRWSMEMQCVFWYGGAAVLGAGLFHLMRQALVGGILAVLAALVIHLSYHHRWSWSTSATLFVLATIVVLLLAYVSSRFTENRRQYAIALLVIISVLCVSLGAWNAAAPARFILAGVAVVSLSSVGVIAALGRR